ncbi:MAG: cytochrome C biogenesis protein CcdA [Actinobacteria bacterium]|nr:cytochrome C biogenesis protein CcdA [Actinomycetota bacterium]|tara:strand:- start:4601 stop:5308 length:708 start_codon:yes stop_codon:yes gene_type:complete
MEINASIAFFFGALSFFSPCVLPLVPGYFAIFSLEKNSKITRLSGALQFVIGFSIVFVSLGALASSVGSFFSRNASLLGQISGVIIIIFGLVLLIPSLNKRYFYSANIVDINNFSKSKNFIMGFTFGFGFTPCIGPVLGALLTLSSKSETLYSGVLYLILFSLGLAVPFLLIAILSDRINLKNKMFTNFQKYSTKVSGITLIALGYLIFTDKIYILASFFQDVLYLLNLDWLSTI